MLRPAASDFGGDTSVGGFPSPTGEGRLIGCAWVGERACNGACVARTLRALHARCVRCTHTHARAHTDTHARAHIDAVTQGVWICAHASAQHTAHSIRHRAHSTHTHTPGASASSFVNGCERLPPRPAEPCVFPALKPCFPMMVARELQGSVRSAILNTHSLQNHVIAQFRRPFRFSDRTCDQVSKWAVPRLGYAKQIAGKLAIRGARRAPRRSAVGRSAGRRSAERSVGRRTARLSEATCGRISNACVLFEVVARLWTTIDSRCLEPRNPGRNSPRRSTCKNNRIPPFFRIPPPPPPPSE